MSGKKDIDQLFREKLSTGREVPYREGAWDNMQEILDQKMPVKSTTALVARLAGIVGALLLMGGLAWYVLSGDEPPVEGEGSVQSTVLPQEGGVDADDVELVDANVAGENTGEDPSDDEGRVVDSQESMREVVRTKAVASKTKNTSKKESMVGGGGKGLGLGSASSAKTQLALMDWNPRRESYLVLDNNNWPDIIGAETDPVQFLSNTKVKKDKMVNFYVTGGMNVALALVGNIGVTKRTSISPFAGMGMAVKLQERLMLHAEWAYSYRGDYNLRHVQELPSEGRSIERIEYHEMVDRVHFIEMPFYFAYAMATRHTLEVGGYFSGMFHNERSGQYVYYGQNVRYESAPEERISDRGLSNYDLGAILGYSYYPNRKMSLGARMHFGFTDISDRRYFTNARTDRNMQYRLVFRYFL